MISFVYPGQGSQIVGMGKDFYKSFKSAKEFFGQVDDLYGEKLSNIIFEGDSQKLNSHNQIALFTVSAAICHVLEHDFNIDITKKASYLAGHSVGEYAALYAGKVIDLKQAVTILKVRQEAMKSSILDGVGGMIAVVNMDIFDAYQIAADASQEEVCQVAIDNCQGQIVVSGHISALKRFIKMAGVHEKSKIFMLDIKYPCHSALMTPVAGQVEECSDDMEFKKPKVPVIFNYTARVENNPDRIKTMITRQIHNQVLWKDTIKFMIKRKVKTIIEIGPGQVLSNITKRINKDIKSYNIAKVDDIEAVVSSISS